MTAILATSISLVRQICALLPRPLQKLARLADVDFIDAEPRAMQAISNAMVTIPAQSIPEQPSDEIAPRIRVVAAVIERGGRFLITQRRAAGSLGGLWEFPSGRVEDSETDAAALQRELRERVDVSIEVGETVAHRTHCYDGYAVELVLYRASLVDGDEPQPVRVDDVRWVAAGELENYPFPPADQKTTDELLGIRRL